MSSPEKGRKRRKPAKPHYCKKQRRTLPDLPNDTNCGVNQPLENGVSPKIESMYGLNSHELGNSSVHEEDLDLSQNYFNQEKSERHAEFKRNGLVWVKHGKRKNDCFWPSFVKSISKTKISVFFIYFSTFGKTEKAYTYNIKSNRLKEFNAENKKILVEEGTRKLSDPRFKQLYDPSTFKKAVELSVSYLIEMEKNPCDFQNEQDIFDFFNTQGESFYEKKYFEEGARNRKAKHKISNKLSPNALLNQNICKTPGKSRPDTAISVVQSSETANQKQLDSPAKSCKELLMLYGTNSSPLGKCTPNKSRPNSMDKNTLYPSSPEKLGRHDSDLSVSRRLLSSFNFIKQSSELVDCIVSGKCDDYLTGLFTGTEFSQRLVEFYEKWDWGSKDLLPKPKKLNHSDIYFEDDAQSQEVLKYLNKFIERYYKSWNHVRKQDCVFHVLLPEATICSIAKTKRRTMPKAEKLFKEGCRFNELRTTIMLDKPLTEEERNVIKQQNRRLAEEYEVSL